MPSPRYFCVYLHCRPDGSPFYVGKGVSGRHRAFELKHNRNRYHQNIVAKYGKENIEVLVFRRDSEQEALDTEIAWIKCLRDNGFKLTNMTDGGEGLSNPSDSVRQFLSKLHKGKKLSAEHKAKMSVSQKARYSKVARENKSSKVSEETKEKMSLSAQARWADDAYRQAFSSRMKQIFAERKALA